MPPSYVVGLPDNLQNNKSKKRRKRRLKKELLDCKVENSQKVEEPAKPILLDSGTDSGYENSVTPPASIENVEQTKPLFHINLEYQSTVNLLPAEPKDAIEMLPVYQSACPHYFFEAPLKKFACKSFVRLEYEQLLEWKICSLVLNRIVDRCCCTVKNSNYPTDNFTSFDAACFMVKNIVSPDKFLKCIQNEQSVVQSDIDQLNYEFLFPENLCGRLIGKSGSFIELIRQKSNSKAIVRMEVLKNNKQVVSIEGRRYEILCALKMIRERFSEALQLQIDFTPFLIEEFFTVLNPVLIKPLLKPQPMIHMYGRRLVRVSSVVSVNHFYVHTLESSVAFSQFRHLMNSLYADVDNIKSVSLPCPNGLIVAFPLSPKRWVRGIVRSFCSETLKATIFLCDYGVNRYVDARLLKNIHSDLAHIPPFALDIFIDGLELELGVDMAETKSNLLKAAHYILNQLLEIEVLYYFVSFPQIVQAFLIEPSGLKVSLKEYLVMKRLATRSQSIRDYVYYQPYVSSVVAKKTLSDIGVDTNDVL